MSGNGSNNFMGMAHQDPKAALQEHIGSHAEKQEKANHTAEVKKSHEKPLPGTQSQSLGSARAHSVQQVNCPRKQNH